MPGLCPFCEVLLSVEGQMNALFNSQRVLLVSTVCDTGCGSHSVWRARYKVTGLIGV